MLERHLSYFRCPATQNKVTGIDVQERRSINGVEHIYQANVQFGDQTYRVRDGILQLGAHKNEELYNKMWEASDSSNRVVVGQDAREALLSLLGSKTFGFLEGKTMVDVGAGLGYRSQAAAQLGADVITLDSSFEGLKRGMQRMAEQLSSDQFARIDFVQANIMETVFNPQQFDVVFSSWALHHTPSTRQALETISPYLKQNGYLAVTVYVPYFPHTIWMCRSEVLSVPREVRQRALAKTGILPQSGVEPIVNIPEIIKKIESDPDTAQIAAAVGLSFLTHRENLDTEYMWVQTAEEVAKWMKNKGLFVDYQRGGTIVGRSLKPGLINYAQKYYNSSQVLGRLKKLSPIHRAKSILP